MTDETEEEFLLPSPNPAQLPQSPLSPAFVTLKVFDDAQTHLAQYLMFAKYQELDVDESLIARY